MSLLRTQVLNCFKQMHRTRLEIFKGDVETLAALREEINMQFRQHKDENNEDQINALLNAAHQAASYMKENVVQLVEKEHKGQVVHEVQVRDDLLFEDVPYQEMPDDVLKQRRKRKTNCSDTNKAP